MYGYHGRALIVDLTTRSVEWEPIPEVALRNFIGGTGLGAYLLYRHCPPGIEPLDPANPLLFVCSPLVGSRLTTSSKFAVLAKSPLTGMIGDSLSSSFLAVELKRSGCDALIVKGRSPELTLLSIQNGDVEFLDASDMRGMSATDTERAVKERIGHWTRVACIGPAGERLVRFASIANDGGRQAGRTGTGAVMGSKNLKAVGVRGSTLPDVFDRDDQVQDLDYGGGMCERQRSLGQASNAGGPGKLIELVPRLSDLQRDEIDLP